MTAPQAAGVIHSDFEKGFIRAETVSITDRRFIYCLEKYYGLCKHQSNQYTLMSISKTNIFLSAYEHSKSENDGV